MREIIISTTSKLKDGSLTLDEANKILLDLFDANEDIDSEDFQQWLRCVDDDETDIEDLHKEYLAEKRANEESRKLGWNPSAGLWVSPPPPPSRKII